MPQMADRPDVERGEPSTPLKIMQATIDYRIEAAMHADCGHVRRMTGRAEDGGVIVESWYCDACEQTLLTIPGDVVGAVRATELG